MIIDYIDHAKSYIQAVPALMETADFAQRVKTENLPAGRYELQNGFVLVQEGVTRPFADALFERHQTYLDIQILIFGHEYVEYADVRSLEEVDPYDKEKDLALLTGSGSKIVVTPDMFYILYPHDGHKPCCHEDMPTKYKKILAKIRMDSLPSQEISLVWGMPL